MPGGVRKHDTVSEAIDGSPKRSSLRTARPARKAFPAIRCRRIRWGIPSSRMRVVASRSAWTRWVGIETGWLRRPPSGTPPPREAGTHWRFQRTRSQAKVVARRLRRSIASKARGETETTARPRGMARHFWEPVMLTSTPQASLWTSSPAKDDTVSRR